MTSGAQIDWWTTNIYGALANIGVPLFVMLSGVLLLNPSKADEPLGSFFKKRFARIALPLAFWTAAYFAWGYYMHGYALTTTNVIQGLLGGSYYHLWFLYLLVGLYLATPVLRVIVKYLDRVKFKFLLAVWVVGTVAVPFIDDWGVFSYNPVMFVFVGWAGYFLLGIFLLKSRIQPKLLYLCLGLGLAWTVLADALLPAVTGGKFMGFFHEPLNLSLVLASASLFLLLAGVPKMALESRPLISRLLHWISKNTLAIYLLHIMVLETFVNGYLGFTLNMQSFSPILEIPLLTLATFAVTALIVYPLSKIPYVNRLIG
jgi:surface polysaccharide O-acyltransferase-like enzyme